MEIPGRRVQVSTTIRSPQSRRVPIRVLTKKEEQGEQVFTVPKSAFGGKEPKPGEQYYFDVKSVHDDEIVMAYSQEEKGEEETPEAPKPEMGGGGGESAMGGMME